MTRPDIGHYALTLARAAAVRSEDPHLQVGTALLRSDGTVAALGYNGAPPGVDIEWADRDDRRRWVIHAEVNALRYVRPGEVSLLASTNIPCETCMLEIAAYRVPMVIYEDGLDPDRYDMARIMTIADVSGIKVYQTEKGDT